MVTGTCTPCSSMVESATVAHAVKNLDGDVLKVGKVNGQWYVVQQFSQLKKDTK